MHAAGEDTSLLKLMTQVANPAMRTVGMWTQARCIELGLFKTDRTLTLLMRPILEELSVGDLCFRKRRPVFGEIKIGKFLLVPLVAMQDVETKVIVVDINQIAHIGCLLQHFGIKFLILDKLCFELLSARFVHAELACAAGIGVCVA